MKYVQILFYNVQDAALFNVQLQGEDQQDESIVVKILQFSPEVLTTLYTHVSDLCFISGTTSVTKILFSSLFGPCVMIFSCIIGKSCKMFRARLVQKFLLVILFSYQKLSIDAFTLIQCVDIENSTVLHVHGDIECQTWWQRATEVYIYFSIVSVFIVLSHAPFYVEDKTMSVKMFILGCLLPVPVMVAYHMRRYVKKSAAETQLSFSPLSEHGVISEQSRIEGSATSNFYTERGSEYSRDFMKAKDERFTHLDQAMGQSIDSVNDYYEEPKIKEAKSKSKFNDNSNHLHIAEALQNFASVQDKVHLAWCP